MATYLTTIKFTDQGIKSIAQTCKRGAAFKALAKKMGVKVTQQYWTLGSFDGLLVLDAPDDATVTALLLQLGRLGNVQTQTLRAFDAAEMEKIVALLPE